MSNEILEDDLDLNRHAIKGHKVRLQINEGGKYVFEEGNSDNVLIELTGAELVAALSGNGNGNEGGVGVHSQLFNLVDPDVRTSVATEYDLMVAHKNIRLVRLSFNTWAYNTASTLEVIIKREGQELYTITDDLDMGGAISSSYGEFLPDELDDTNFDQGELLRIETNLSESASGLNASDMPLGLDVYIEWEDRE